MNGSDFLHDLAQQIIIAHRQGQILLLCACLFVYFQAKEVAGTTCPRLVEIPQCPFFKNNDPEDQKLKKSESGNHTVKIWSLKY